jgi:hypothetical protein
MDRTRWIDLLESEYLDGFVKDGGAAVKFALVDDPREGDGLIAEMSRRALAHNYVVAKVDSAVTRVQYTQNLFFSIARQVPWSELARRYLTATYRQLGYQADDHDIRIERVAGDNGVDQNLLRMEVRLALQHQLIRPSETLAKDFRWAMLGLCAGEAGLIPDVSTIHEWLKGELRLISGLKNFQIFRKIARHNARAMIASLGAWCRMAGMNGFTLLLDIRQLAVAKRPEIRPDTIFYTLTGVVDCYELLRQLIDDTDDLDGILCLVLSTPDLFDQDNRRGVGAYKALKERVFTDVVIHQAPNPLSSVVSFDSHGMTS